MTAAVMIVGGDSTRTLATDGIFVFVRVCVTLVGAFVTFPILQIHASRTFLCIAPIRAMVVRVSRDTATV